MVTSCLTKTENITKKSLTLSLSQKNFYTISLSKGTILETNSDFLQKNADVRKNKASLDTKRYIF